LYACPNGTTTHRLVKLNTGTPTFQRAPGEATGNYALEVAMDELAIALALDPLTLRLRNYAEQEAATGKPFSSKHLRECYAQAAERFGWSQRTAMPRSMREGRELVGFGMATASYPAHRMGASARGAVAGWNVRRPIGHAGHRHRHVHGDDAGRRRCARRATEPRALRARRYATAARAGLGRVDERRERWSRRAGGVPSAS
jgi:CO/xanthine dehydrogenase Mo-binding subunit